MFKPKESSQTDFDEIVLQAINHKMVGNISLIQGSVKTAHYYPNVLVQKIK